MKREKISQAIIFCNSRHHGEKLTKELEGKFKSIDISMEAWNSRGGHRSSSVFGATKSPSWWRQTLQGAGLTSAMSAM